MLKLETYDRSSLCPENLFLSTLCGIEFICSWLKAIDEVLFDLFRWLFCFLTAEVVFVKLLWLRFYSATERLSPLTKLAAEPFNGCFLGWESICGGGTICERLIRFLAVVIESIESFTDAITLVSRDCRFEFSPLLRLLKLCWWWLWPTIL